MKEEKEKEAVDKNNQEREEIVRKRGWGRRKSGMYRKSGRGERKE